MKVTVNIKTEMDVKETNTIGKNAYVVALCCGGLMEDPEIYYSDYQLIYADSEKEAKTKYDELNKCNYFYGEVIGQIVNT